jgi:16S rRNA (uracil1498-N3)-methyltransferase
MNLLLFEAGELEGDLLPLSDARARHLVDVLRVRPGDRVRVGQIDGPRGRAEVLRADGDGVVLSVTLAGPTPPRPALDLVLALPRPKVLKRLWAPLAALGVGRVFLTRAARVERYYFDSHAVRPETYRPRLLEGLAQARDTRLPEVEVHRCLSAMLRRRLGDLPYRRRLVADPTAERGVAEAVRGLEREASVLLAVGPEGGWQAEELELLQAEGFAPVGLGARTLRSDTATVLLVGLVHHAR